MFLKAILRALQFLYILYAAMLFLALMIPVFIFAVLAAPAGASRGGNLIYYACRAWAGIWFPLVGIFHRNINAPEAGTRDSYIYIANHISWLDAALIPIVFRRPLRPLGKAEAGKIPLFGFIYRKAVVSVDRSSSENRHRSVQRLKSVLRKGVAVLVFPEGTFNETHQPLARFYDGAFRIAIETGTPIRPVLFLDTYARMPYDRKLALNPGRSRAVFLPPIPVDGLGADDIAALRDTAFRQMEEGLSDYQASWISRIATDL